MTSWVLFSLLQSCLFIDFFKDPTLLSGLLWTIFSFLFLVHVSHCYLKAGTHQPVWAAWTETGWNLARVYSSLSDKSRFWIGFYQTARWKISIQSMLADNGGEITVLTLLVLVQRPVIFLPFNGGIGGKTFNLLGWYQISQSNYTIFFGFINNYVLWWTTCLNINSIDHLGSRSLH